MMKHLTVDEIIDFVSIVRIDADSLALASKVNTHIKNCSECLRKVRAFQVIYDELLRADQRPAAIQVARETLKERAAAEAEREMLHLKQSDFES